MNTDRTLPGTIALAALTTVAVLCLGRLFATTSFLGPVLAAGLGTHALAWA
ncbi:MAG: hypothetical protein JO367_14445, partial [Actinobacteria bacterium]|nr:hypothetical protein [Actinomycetota bacterium]